MGNARCLALLALVALITGIVPGAAWARMPAFSQASGNGRVAAQLGEPIEPDAYEPDDSPEDASELSLDGVPQERTLHVASDNDWVSIMLAAGDRVAIYTTGFCDTFMFLYGPDAARLLRRDDDSGQDLNARIEYTARDEGTYYARVIPFDNQDTCASYELVGEYLPPVPPDAYEPDDSADTARELPLDASVQEHSIHTGGDEDWAALRLQASNRINIFTSGRCDMLLDFYAPDGVTLLAEDDDSGVGLNADIEYVVGQAGTYFARARLISDDDVCDSYGLTGTLLPPVPPDVYEPDDSSAQAKPLPLDGTPQARSFHVNGDNDWVSFSLNAGDRLFLMTTGPCDTLLFLYGEDGTTLLRRDDDSGEDLNAALLYTALTTGTYYARVAPISRARGICDGYRLYGARFPSTVATPTVTPTATPSPTAAPAGPSPTATPQAPGPRTPTPQRPPGF